jgi:hypothetical protein
MSLLCNISSYEPNTCGMPCLCASFSARARSRADTAATRTSGTAFAGDNSASGVMRAAPSTPMRSRSLMRRAPSRDRALSS